jgi:hypothetical protein
MTKRMGRQKVTSYDHPSYRRRGVKAFPIIPGEEMRNQPGRGLTHEWTIRDLERGWSTPYNATGKENADREMPNVLGSRTPNLPQPLPRNSISRDDSDLSPKPNFNDDALQKGAGESPRAHSGDSNSHPAVISDGTSKPTAVDILLTEAMR